MTASNLEPTSASATPAGGEYARDDVTERVTSPSSSSSRELSKRVTVAAGGERETHANDGNNNQSALADAKEATCCRGRADQDASTSAAEQSHRLVPPPFDTLTSYNPIQAAAAHKQQFAPPVPPPPPQAHAISIYPPAHNFVHYPLAPVPPPLVHQPPPPPQLSFYQQQPPHYFTWTCPITGNYHHQLPALPPAGGHIYYQHHHHHPEPAQPFVVHHHHQLGGPAIYQSASATNHQHVTQVAGPPDKGANDDKCQSHVGPPSSSPTRGGAGIGSSAAGASLDYAADCAQQATQQSDKSSSAPPLDTAALLAACGPIRGDDKAIERAQAPSCAQQSNKISYRNDNGGGEAEDDDDDDDERGSCRRSSLRELECRDDNGQGEEEEEEAAAGTRLAPTSRDCATANATTVESTAHESAGNPSLQASLCSRHHQDRDCGTCSSQANPPGPHGGQSRANLMVEPTCGGDGRGSGECTQDDDKADSEEEEADDRAPLLKDANLDEHPSVDVIDQQQAPQPPQPPTSESHQISINGTTFYNVDPARLFLPPPPPPPPDLVPHHYQQQLPFLLSYHNLGPHLTNAYHPHHNVAPATTTTRYSHPAMSHRASAQLSLYGAASYQHPLPAHNRLILPGPAPVPPVGYSDWLHHTTAYQQAQQLFGPPYPLGPLRPTIQHSQSNNDLAQAQMPPGPAQPVATSTTSVSQLKLGYNLIPLLPIQAIPTRVRQAYGMDKVWQDEFEQLFAQFISQVVWTLVEVETNPSVRASSRILDYKSRYVVRVDGPPVEVSVGSSTCASSGDGASEAQEDECEEECREDEGEEDEEDRVTSKSKGQVEDGEEEGEAGEGAQGGEVEDEDDSSCSINQDQSRNCESDCDSGAVLNSSTSGSSSFEATCCQQAVDELSNTSSDSTGSNTRSFTPMTEVGGKVQSTSGQLVDCGARKFPLKFRMFIDSAKVRFCCETCGHGWTSMKGRVVFWYELFELVDADRSAPRSSAPLKYANEQQQQQHGGVSNLIGYCAYKLFGQQCDVCKVENRFERPMWYPEEVTKVLCNLYNKIGQVYFGFRMPTIDKQRRAGKPKTSHNSLLCQACHDGVCTDRK